MKVRAAGQADLPGIIAINRDSNPHPWTAHHFAKAIEAGQIRVVEQDGTLLSFAIWQVVCDEAELHLLVTDQHHLRQGAAGILLADFVRTHPEVQRVILEVRAGNAAARALYAKHGFVEIARRQDYYLLPTEDAIIMEKRC